MARVLGVELPQDLMDEDTDDHPTLSRIDLDELWNGPRPESLQPGANLDAVQTYQIGQIARAQAAIGESLRAHRDHTRQALASVQARLDLVERAMSSVEKASGASELVGRKGARSSLAAAIAAGLVALLEVLPKLLALLE